MRELARERVLGLEQCALLDDQEVAGFTDHLADLVLVDGDYLVAFQWSSFVGLRR